MITRTGEQKKEKQIKLDFKDKEDIDIYDAKKGYFLSAYLHNNEKRLTIIKHRYGSFTFEKFEEKNGETKMYLKYFVDS